MCYITANDQKKIFSEIVFWKFVILTSKYDHITHTLWVFKKNLKFSIGGCCQSWKLCKTSFTINSHLKFMCASKIYVYLKNFVTNLWFLISFVLPLIWRPKRISFSNYNFFEDEDIPLKEIFHTRAPDFDPQKYVTNSFRANRFTINPFLMCSRKDIASEKLLKSSFRASSDRFMVTRRVRLSPQQTPNENFGISAVTWYYINK